MLLSDGSIWRSVDGGLTLVSMQFLLNNDRFRGIEQTIDGSRVFLLTYGAWIWVSDDAGATFTNSSAVPFYIHDMQVHPSVPSRILATGLTHCCQESLACTSCKAFLIVSSDKGDSWKNITDYLYYRRSLSYAWTSVFSDSNDISLAFISYTDKSGDQRVKLGEPINLELMRDFNNPSSIVSQVPNGGPFVFRDASFMMARVATGRPGLSNLMVSRDFGTTWSTIAFPPTSSFDSLREWLPTESGNPFLGVFDGPDYTDGHVYVSTGGNASFTISLRHLISRFNKPHWTHIGETIPGTYIANAHPGLDRVKFATFITYNHGGHWHKVELDDKKRRSSIRRDDDDDDDNRVHLAAPFPGPKFHAPISAPGLIIAAGQVGSLLTSWEGQNVLISRDGGRTWMKSLSGSFVVFGSNGGSVILAIEHSDYTDKLSYSLDFGSTWSTCTFAPYPVKAISMRSNFDDHMSPIVILDALNTNGSMTIFTLNMTTVFNRTCTTADFGSWRLVDSDGNRCVFGMERVYARRLPQSMCQKTLGQSHSVTSIRCECREEDFICPYCYERNDDGNCDFLWDDCDDSRPHAPDNCTGSWEDPSNPANVKLPDSICQGGLTLDEIESEISCPPPPFIDSPPPPVATLQNDILITVGAIALALCGILIVGCYYGCRNLILGSPPIDVVAWKQSQLPATDNDVRREIVQHELEYQSDLDGSMEMTRTNNGGSPNHLETLEEEDLTITSDEVYSTLDV
jgi:hypothetical protein